MTWSNLKKRVRRALGIDPNMRPNLCFAQDGEDLLLDRLLSRSPRGFYVDIGAHHPVRFSNTYLFYRRGWSGINVDAEPGSMRLFERLRQRDINIECGVAGHSGTLMFHRFNEPALNTFDEVEASLKDRPPYRLTERTQVAVRRLDEILNQYLPENQEIDFMSVDVEGKDYEVLDSNDWTRFRPKYVLAETLRSELLDLVACPVVQLLDDKGYKPIAKVYNTMFFERKADR